MSEQITSKHTPGPWVYQSTTRFISPVDGGLESIALMHPRATIEDARLIAAAPELLKVAQSVVYVHEHSGSNAQFILRGLVDDARAAIAKALGQAVQS